MASTPPSDDAEEVSFASTNIDSALYSPSTQTLSITFARTGDSYDYFNVPAATWEAFKAAPSAGRFFAQNIKGVFG